MFNANEMNRISKNQFSKEENQILLLAIAHQVEGDFRVHELEIDAFVKHFNKLNFDVRVPKKMKVVDDRNGVDSYKMINVSWKDK